MQVGSDADVSDLNYPSIIRVDVTGVIECSCAPIYAYVLVKKTHGGGEGWGCLPVRANMDSEQGYMTKNDHFKYHRVHQKPLAYGVPRRSPSK